jgi:hypothetical protein
MQRNERITISHTLRRQFSCRCVAVETGFTILSPGNTALRMTLLGSTRHVDLYMRAAFWNVSFIWLQEGDASVNVLSRVVWVAEPSAYAFRSTSPPLPPKKKLLSGSSNFNVAEALRVSLLPCTEILQISQPSPVSAPPPHTSVAMQLRSDMQLLRLLNDQAGLLIHALRPFTIPNEQPMVSLGEDLAMSQADRVLTSMSHHTP